MTTVYAGITIAELCASPTRILKRAKDEEHAVTILSHNKPAGYLLSPKLMDAMLEQWRIASRKLVPKHAYQL